MSENEVRNFLKEIEQMEQGIRENHVQTQSQLILLHYFFRAVGIINQNTALKALNMLKQNTLWRDSACQELLENGNDIKSVSSIHQTFDSEIADLYRLLEVLNQTPDSESSDLLSLLTHKLQ